MECAPSVRRGFFPLDEELQLLAGHFTPSVYEGITRLGIWMLFARAVKEKVLLACDCDRADGATQTATLDEADVDTQATALGREVVTLWTAIKQAAQREAHRGMTT